MQKNNTKRDILLTMALPYANGQIHLGHMVEAIQTDIWARFQKLREHSVLFLSGTDAHGTAVMLAAEKEGVSPESYVANIRDDQLSDFKGFSIEFDNFYTTHSAENKELACHIYQQLEQRGEPHTGTQGKTCTH